MTAKRNPTKMGRPRGFDEETALEAAMLLFWMKEYEGATTSDLAKTMGMNASSMYAAFGSKEELFKRAFVRYCHKHLTFFSTALALPAMSETVKALLEGTVGLVTKPGYPRGCLMVQGSMATAEPIRMFLSTYRRQGDDALRRRAEVAKKHGDLDSTLNPRDFARYLVTLTTGMAVQASNGAGKAELKRQADLALRLLGYEPHRHSR